MRVHTITVCVPVCVAVGCDREVGQTGFFFFFKKPYFPLSYGPAGVSADIVKY